MDDDGSDGACTYDDVWNYASATPSFMPERVVVHLNGFKFLQEDPCLVLPSVSAGDRKSVV